MTFYHRILLFLSIFLVPIVLFSIVLVGFIPSRFPQNFVYDAHTYINYFSHGIFSSRLLGIKVLDAFYIVTNYLAQREWLPDFFYYGAVLNAGMFSFYYSLVFINLTFLIASNCVCYLILNSSAYKHVSVTQTINTIIVLDLLIALTQYVLMHYDCLFYFLLLLAFYFIFCQKNIILLFAVFVVANFTKETSAIILSLYAYYYFLNHHFSKHKELGVLVGLIAIYIIQYFILKAFSGHEVFYEWHLQYNFGKEKLYSVISLLFFLTAVLMMSKNHGQLKKNLIFILFCSPYIAAMPLLSVLWEIRIWVPVLMPLLLISHLNNDSNQLSASNKINLK